MATEAKVTECKVNECESYIVQEKDDKPLQILLESMQVLLKLATKDSADYQASLKKSHHLHAPLSVCHLQKTLEDLQSKWPLDENPPTMKLCTSIHRFHSEINLLQKDAEEQAVMYHKLTEKLQESQQQNERLGRLLLKLNTKNQKLAAKVQQRSHEKRSLVKYVETYVKQVQESKKEQKQLTEQNEAYRLRAHEQFLVSQRQDTNPLRRRCFSQDDVPMATPPRGRCQSSDSNFSDLDALDFINDIKYMTEGATGRLDEEEPMEESELSCFSDDSVASSLVTAEAATLRLAASCSPPSTPPRSRALSSDSSFGKSFLGSAWNHSSKTKEPPIFTISFPSVSDIGLQFKKVPLEHQPLKAPSPPATPQRGTQPKGLLDDAVSRSGDEEQPNLDDPPANKNDDNQSQQKGLLLNWNQMFGKSAAGSTDHNPNKDVSNIGSFVVCGFEGFDDDRNERPRLGAKLTAINDDPVNSAWSLEEMQDQLRQAESITCEKQRNDAGTSKEEEKKSSEAGDHISAGLITLSFILYPEAKKGKEGDEGMQGSSRFSFRKKHTTSPSPKGSSLKFSQRKNDTANKYDEKASGFPKMPSFFPRGGADTSSEVHSKQAEEEEIQLSSPNSESKPGSPLFKSPPKDKDATDKEGVGDADEQEGVKATYDSTAPSSATNLMMFLSPQNYYQKPARPKKTAETNDQAKESLANKELIEPDTVEPSNDAVAPLHEEGAGQDNEATSVAVPVILSSASSTAPHRSSGTSLMHFLSPQNFYQKPTIAKKKIEAGDQIERGTADVKACEPNDKTEICEVVPSKESPQGEVSASTNETKATSRADLTDSAPLNSASNLLQLLSPQNYYRKPVASAKKEGADDKPLPSAEVIVPSQQEESEDAPKQDSTTSDEDHDDGATLVRTEAEETDGGDDSRAGPNGDKFSLKSMGNIFMKPFS